MPDEIIRKIISQILMPKLSQALQSWNPKKSSEKDEVNLEDWFVPWRDLIGKKNIKQLFDDVAKAQITPVFTDRKLFKIQALDLFRPWAEVLDTKDTIEFANRYVYPKLTSLIKKLEVDPSD